MKSKAQILLFCILWGLNTLGIVYSTLSIVHSHPIGTSNTQKYSLKEEEADEECTQEGRCYRPPPPNDNIPKIMTPQEGMEIYSQTPTLRWQPVENIVEYTIVIDGIGVEWIEKPRGDAWRIRYDGPEFQAGEEYTFEINANNIPDASEVTFKMVDREKFRKIEAEITRLQQTHADRAERDLQIARFYHNEGLIVDAIDKLEDSIENNTQTSETYCFLARLYEEIDLPELANQIARSCSP